ncbi:MAG: rhodanese-like domain-containing protein [Armatimonadota bacterium]
MLLRRHASASPGHSDALTVIAGALAIVIGASALGLAVNHLSPRRLPLLPAASAQPARLPAASSSAVTPAAIPLPRGLEAITIAEARAAYDKHLALFLDARSADLYAEAHIPDAVSLPADAFDDRFPDAADKIEANPFIIIYCEGGDCSDAIHVGERLLEYGFLGIRIMVDGFEPWAEASNPVTKAAAP